MDLSDNRRSRRKMRLFRASLEHTNWSSSKQKYENTPQNLQGRKKQPTIRFRDGYEKVVTILMVRMSCRSEVDESSNNAWKVLMLSHNTVQHNRYFQTIEIQYFVCCT